LRIERGSATIVAATQLLDIPTESFMGAIEAVILSTAGRRRMGRPGIRDLVGRAMIDKEFIAALVRDPDTLLAEYELSAEERSAIMQAVGRTNTSEPERTHALRVVLMKRWAT